CQPRKPQEKRDFPEAVMTETVNHANADQDSDQVSQSREVRWHGDKRVEWLHLRENALNWVSQLRLEWIKQPVDGVRTNEGCRQTQSANQSQTQASLPWKWVVPLQPPVDPFPGDCPQEQSLAGNDARVQVAPKQHDHG